ncbi:MAG: hypothetical protein J7M18_05110 [Candidatus Eremiobacteraeota bacterium]|nr:hypothetical protein [Candidatus Eremiobacteraeota bacterium]
MSELRRLKKTKGGSTRLKKSISIVITVFLFLTFINGGCNFYEKRQKAKEELEQYRADGKALIEEIHKVENKYKLILEKTSYPPNRRDRRYYASLAEMTRGVRRVVLDFQRRYGDTPFGKTTSYKKLINAANLASNANAYLNKKDRVKYLEKQKEANEDAQLFLDTQRMP